MTRIDFLNLTDEQWKALIGKQLHVVTKETEKDFQVGTYEETPYANDAYHVTHIVGTNSERYSLDLIKELYILE